MLPRGLKPVYIQVGVFNEDGATSTSTRSRSSEHQRTKPSRGKNDDRRLPPFRRHRYCRNASGRGQAAPLYFEGGTEPSRDRYGGLLRTYPDGSRIRVSEMPSASISSRLLRGRRGKAQDQQAKMDHLSLLQPTKFKLYDPFHRIRAVRPITSDHVPRRLSRCPIPGMAPIVNPVKDPTPAAISNRSQSYHHINTVVDPVLSPAGNGYDDWHYHQLLL